MVIGLIAKKEIAECLATFRFWFAALLAVALTVLAMLASAESYKTRRSIWQERSAAEQVGLRMIHAYSFLEPVALRPPAPLSVIDEGFDARISPALRIGLFTAPGSAQEEPLGNEFLTAWPTVDVTIIVGIALAFIALLLSCDAFVRERERGILRLLVAARVTRRQLLAGKYLGGIAILAGLLLVVLTIGFVALHIVAGSDLRLSHCVRLAVLAGIYLAYLSLMLLSGLALSLYARSSSRALAYAIIGWLIIVVIAPDVASAWATDTWIVQDLRWKARLQEFRRRADRRREVQDVYAHDPLISRFSGYAPIFADKKFGTEPVLLRFGSARYYDEMAGFFAFYAAAGQRFASDSDADYMLAEAASRANWHTVRNRLVIFPRVLLDEAAHTLAGTGIESESRFLEAGRRYRELLLNYLSKKGAFKSWRWFTDETPETLFPWPRYFGLSPDEVGDREIEHLSAQLVRSPLNEARRRRIQEAQDDSRRVLQLGDLPRFIYREADILMTCRRAGEEAYPLLWANLLVAGLAWRAAGRKP